jgi:CRP/FNR family transcriptional regulator, anaerobic regulatory protein
MVTLETYINQYFGIHDLNEIKSIVHLFKPATYKKGDYILQTGKRCNILSFVQQGLLRIFALHDGKEVTQWISKNGYFAVDLSSFINETPSRFNIQALEKTTVFNITKADYKTINDTIPSWATLEKLFLVKCFTTLEDRIFNHLHMSAEERYQSFFEDNSELFNQVPLQYIASMLGMTPETLSRIRKNSY